MLLRELKRKGLARVLSLVLAVSLAMPGTAMAAAAQAPDEASAEAYGAESVEAAEAAEDADALADEGSEAEDFVEEGTAAGTADEEEPAGAEEEPAGAEDEEEPAGAEDEAEPAGAEDEAEDEDTEAEAAEDAAPAEDEEDPADEEDSTEAATGETAAESEEEIAAELEAPADQEDAAAPAAAAEVNKVTSVNVKDDYSTITLGVSGVNTYQIDVEVTYDTSTSYAANEPIFFKSEDESVVTVDSNGKVTAVGKGSTSVIVYTQTEEDGYTDEEEWGYLYFDVSESTVTVKFDLNTGSLADGLESKDEDTYKMYTEGTTVAKGETIYFDTDFWNGSERVPVAVRDGYKFAGWTETKNGTDILDYSYKPTRDITLYAKWIKVFIVKLDTNTGTWNSSYYERVYGNGCEVERGEMIWLPSYSNVSRSGYKMIGWTASKNGDTILTGDYKVTKDITLYAKWAKVFKITFNAGTGYFDNDKTVKTKTVEATKGSTVGEYTSYGSYTPRNGSKVFLGWYKDSTLKYPAKKSDPVTKDITYYAKWETKVYKVTVTNLKGASYSNRATDKYVSEENSTAESYSFYIRQGDEIGYLSAYKNDERARFFLDKDCKTKPFYSSYVPTGNITVYAKWNTQVKVNWDAAGGKDYNGKSTGTVMCKKNLMCEDLPRSLTKTGYYFVGWYDTANTAKILPASHVFKKNTNVKAKWAKGIKITFKANGGTFSGGKEPVAYIKAKTPVDNWIDPFISRKGYTFKGWKSSATGKVVTSLHSEKPAKAITYTAVWAKTATTATVTVTLMAGAGSFEMWDDSTDRITYASKLVVKVPKNSTLAKASFYADLSHDEPYKKMYVAAWSLTKTGAALKGDYKFTKNVTLYPVWRKSSYLHVALVTNGGALDNYPNNNPAVLSAKNGTYIVLPTSSRIEKEGFTFVGWYTDPALTKRITASKYKVTKNCYLYAKWRKK